MVILVALADLVVDLAATRASQAVKARVVPVDSIRAQEHQAVAHPDQRGGANEP